MFPCIICHWESPLDDVVARSAHACLCLRCYHREVGSPLTMPKSLQRQLYAVLAALSA